MFKFQNSPKQFFIVLFDFIVFIFVTFLTLSLNSDTLGFSINDIFIILSAPIIAIPIFLYFGIYRVIVRYIGFDSIIVIFKAISIYSILWTIFAQIISIKFVFLPALIIHWCFSIILIILYTFYCHIIDYKSIPIKKVQEKSHTFNQCYCKKFL